MNSLTHSLTSQALTADDRQRIIFAASRCLHLPPLEFEKLYRSDEYATTARAGLIPARQRAIKLLVRIADKLAADHQATAEEIAAAFESVSLRPGDLGVDSNGALILSKNHVGACLREINRGFLEILLTNREVQQ